MLSSVNKAANFLITSRKTQTIAKTGQNEAKTRPKQQQRKR